MFVRQLVLAGLLLVSAYSMPTFAAAAEFNMSGPPGGPYKILLHGDIAEGDVLKLQKLLAPIDAVRTGPYDDLVLLYLDSPGGDYAEGLRLSSLIRTKGLGTRVLAGAECMSACALMFMHGAASDPDGDEYLDRKMEVGAKVGFHAPYIVLPDNLKIEGADARAMVESAYATALRQFSVLLQTGDKILDSELLIKMLRTPPGELTMIDTYGDLLMWNVDLTSYPPVKTLTLNQMKMACQNLWDQKNGKRGEATYEALSKDNIMKPKLHKHLADGGDWYQVVVDEYQIARCNLKVRKMEDGLEIRSLGFSYDNEQMPTDTTVGAVVNAAYLQPPAAKIATGN